jgi:SAM-dependent methyltransferase
MSPDGSTHADPGVAVPEPLRSLLAEIAALIAQITAHISSVSPGELQSVLTEYRGTFYRAMDALGVGIIDFLAEDPPPDQVQAVRTQIVGQIREWSTTSPLLGHSLRGLRGQTSEPELVRALLQELPAGADIPALIFNDYYGYSVGGIAFRGRLSMLVQAVLQAMARCAAAGMNPVRVLSLHISGADEILLLAQDKTFAEMAEVTCIDPRPHALREMRRDLQGRLEKPYSCVNADALHYAERLNRPSEQFDIIYGVSIFEHLGMDSASRLARDCHTLLNPGGVLLAGSVTPSIPISEQIMRAWLTDWDLQYHDEATWRGILTQAGFDARRLRFVYEPLKANVLVSAEKKAPY